MRYSVWFSHEHEGAPGSEVMVARNEETAARDFVDQWHRSHGVEGGSYEGPRRVMVRALDEPYPVADEFEVIQEIKFVVAHS